MLQDPEDLKLIEVYLEASTTLAVEMRTAALRLGMTHGTAHLILQMLSIVTQCALSSGTNVALVKSST